MNPKNSQHPSDEDEPPAQSPASATAEMTIETPQTQQLTPPPLAQINPFIVPSQNSWCESCYSFEEANSFLSSNNNNIQERNSTTQQQAQPTMLDVNLTTSTTMSELAYAPKVPHPLYKQRPTSARVVENPAGSHNTSVGSVGGSSTIDQYHPVDPSKNTWTADDRKTHRHLNIQKHLKNQEQEEASKMGVKKKWENLEILNDGEKLGSGGVGNVYLVRVTLPERRQDGSRRVELRAAKELRDTVELRRRHRELKYYQANCEHPNLVRYLFYGKPGNEYEDNAQVQMDFMNLGSLQTVINQFPETRANATTTSEKNCVVDGEDEEQKQQYQDNVGAAFHEGNNAATPAAIASSGDKRFVNISPLTCEDGEVLTKSIGYQLLMGLDAFHHRLGLMHRDITRGNVLLRDDGRVKICDFDTAVSAQNVHDTNCGTPWYGAPEVLGAVIEAAKAKAAGEKPKALEQNLSADIWSVGVILFELATGHHPYSHFCKPGNQKVPPKNKNNDGEPKEKEKEFGSELAQRVCYILDSYQDKIDFNLVKNEDLRDLLEQCLKDKPTDRIGAEAALRHRYFEEWYQHYCHVFTLRPLAAQQQSNPTSGALQQPKRTMHSVNVPGNSGSVDGITASSDGGGHNSSFNNHHHTNGLLSAGNATEHNKSLNVGVGSGFMSTPCNSENTVSSSLKGSTPSMEEGSSPLPVAPESTFLITNNSSSSSSVVENNIISTNPLWKNTHLSESRREKLLKAIHAVNKEGIFLHPSASHETMALWGSVVDKKPDHKANEINEHMSTIFTECECPAIQQLRSWLKRHKVEKLYPCKPKSYTNDEMGSTPSPDQNSRRSQQGASRFVTSNTTMRAGGESQGRRRMSKGEGDQPQQQKQEKSIPRDRGAGREEIKNDGRKKQVKSAISSNSNVLCPQQNTTSDGKMGEKAGSGPEERKL